MQATHGLRTDAILFRLSARRLIALARSLGLLPLAFRSAS